MTQRLERDEGTHDRVKASSEEQDQIHVHPAYIHNVNESFVVVDGKIVPLTPNQNRLLELLERNSNMVVSYAIITDRVWRDRGLKPPSHSSMRSDIARLRAKIEPRVVSEPSKPQYLLSVQDFGYILHDPSRLKRARFQQTTHK